ncbi:unnamed protein product [Chilo suppressalis]|uniref:Potassium channel domain-containing protein n=1 Tax=Chilo suppressalis TaxID=168631 RepID=A0ABN8B2Z3_CHISP|nr:unnamed protein product [Chilo suppressalis]
MEKVRYPRIHSYGSMSSSRNEDDMTVHSQLFPYPKKMRVEREILYEEEHPPFQPLFATSKLFGKARFTCLLVMYVVFYLVYLVSGALVFSALEAPLENQIRLDVIRAKQEFMLRHPDVTDEDLETLLDEVIRASNRGVTASKNVSGGPNWSFGQSLFFSSTVVTTIVALLPQSTSAVGPTRTSASHCSSLPLSSPRSVRQSLAPSSTVALLPQETAAPGKLFCMVYALLGIPLTLVLLSALVERLLLPATALLRALNASLGHLYRPFTIRLAHLLIIVLVLVIFFLVLPAVVFAAIEPDWDFLDSFYYCFISLTTIGLGDYIPGDAPGQPYRPLYKVATTLFYDIPQLNLSTVFSSVKLDEDPEKMRLSGSGALGPGYGLGGLVMRDQRRSVVHIRPHLDDSPSPEDTTPPQP